jgi:nucleoside-diphosphate-sugar epimerase
MPDRLNVVWDTSKPAGDKIRILDTARAKALGFEAKTSLREGLQKTILWYREKKNSAGHRYNVFN